MISPYAKKGISSAFHSHVSLVEFCEVTFGLKALNARVTASDNMEDCFDFTQKPLGPLKEIAKPAKKGADPKDTETGKARRKRG